MRNKICFALIFALLAGVIFSTTGLAQSVSPVWQGPHGALRGVGKLVAVGTDRFTIETHPGNERTFLVDENTRLRSSTGDVLVLSDMQPGDWVAGIAAPGPQGELLAHLVIRLPEDYDPSQRLGIRVAGTVSAVDGAAGSFTLHTLRGEDLVFTTNANTIFAGGISSLQELQPGMQAAVGAFQQSDGSRLSLVVLVRRPIIRHAGEITSVDAAGGWFELKTRRGEMLRFDVAAPTRFISRDGAIDGLDDVLPGMKAGVAAIAEPDGSLTAVNVVVGTSDELPKYDQRRAGRIVSLEDAGFILRAHNGEQITLAVDGETIYRGRAGRIQALRDLRPGMAVLVRIETLEDGSYLARLVIVGKR